MRYKATLKKCQEFFPRIFRNEADVLDHLFFVNGNGFEWKNGQLIGGWMSRKKQAEYHKENEKMFANMRLEFEKNLKEIQGDRYESNRKKNLS